MILDVIGRLGSYQMGEFHWMRSFGTKIQHCSHEHTALPFYLLVFGFSLLPDVFFAGTDRKTGAGNTSPSNAGVASSENF